jgi:hypothetical protein
MDRIIPGDLPALCRERAEPLRSFGDPACARLWDIAAVELERAQALFAAETASLTEAARVSPPAKAAAPGNFLERFVEFRSGHSTIW